MSLIEDLSIVYPGKQVLVNTSVANKTFVGIADPGALTTDAKWSLYLIDVTTATTPVLMYPRDNGIPSFANTFKWSNILEYTFSQTSSLTAPTITTATMASNNATTTVAKVGDVVTLTIVASANLITKPTVTICGRDATVTMGANNTLWSATYTLVTGDTEGVVPFTINGKNYSGVAMAQVSTLTSGVGVTFYKTAPIATLEYSKDAGSTWATTIAVKDADTLRVRATFNKPLLDAPIVKLAIDNAILSATNMTKTSTTVYYYDLNVPAGNIATATCSLSIGTDVAGNVVEAVPVNATFEVDNTAPTLSTAVRLTDTRIEVNLSDFAIASTITKSNAGGFTVTKTGTATTYAVTAIAPGTSNKKVMLTVTNMEGASLTGVTVTYTSGGNGTITDDAGNALATDGTGVVIPAW